jgi:hypothetical protein
MKGNNSPHVDNDNERQVSHMSKVSALMEDIREEKASIEELIEEAIQKGWIVEVSDAVDAEGHLTRARVAKTGFITLKALAKKFDPEFAVPWEVYAKKGLAVSYQHVLNEHDFHTKEDELVIAVYGDK